MSILENFFNLCALLNCSALRCSFFPSTCCETFRRCIHKLSTSFNVLFLNWARRKRMHMCSLGLREKVRKSGMLRARWLDVWFLALAHSFFYIHGAEILMRSVPVSTHYSRHLLLLHVHGWRGSTDWRVLHWLLLEKPDAYILTAEKLESWIVSQGQTYSSTLPEHQAATEGLNADNAKLTGFPTASTRVIWHFQVSMPLSKTTFPTTSWEQNIALLQLSITICEPEKTFLMPCQ